MLVRQAALLRRLLLVVMVAEALGGPAAPSLVAPTAPPSGTVVPPHTVVQLQRRRPPLPMEVPQTQHQRPRRMAVDGEGGGAVAPSLSPSPLRADDGLLVSASGEEAPHLSAPLHHNAAEYVVELSTVTSTTGGNEQGESYFLLHVDTGSAVMALPSRLCTGCCPHSLRYGREEERGVGCGERGLCTARGCRGLLCGFEMAYADRSRIEGVLVRDRVRMSALEWNATFGAITNAHRFCVRGVDGILGLARPGTATNPLNCVPNCVEPPLDALMREHPSMPDLFALQLRDAGGRLLVGGVGDATVLRGPVAWCADLGAHAGHYRVALGAITVDLPDGPRDILGRGRTTTAMLDSGTSVIAVPTPLYSAIVAGFLAGNCTTRGICAHARESGEHVFAYCFPRDSFPMDLYPTLSLGLSHGVTLSLRPRQYLLERTADDGVTVMVCSAIREAKASRANLVLGAPFFRAFYTVFDRANGRIGFAEHADGEGGSIAVDLAYEEPAPDTALYTSWENGAGVWVGLTFVGALASISGGVLVCLYARPPSP